MNKVRIKKIKFRDLPRQKVEKIEIKDGRKIISSCIMYSADKMAIIYNLFTKEKWRGMGYATKCISAAKHHFLKGNMSILLAGSSVGRDDVIRIFEKNKFKRLEDNKNNIIFYCLNE